MAIHNSQTSNDHPILAQPNQTAMAGDEVIAVASPEQELQQQSLTSQNNSKKEEQKEVKSEGHSSTETEQGQFHDSQDLNDTASASSSVSSSSSASLQPESMRRASNADMDQFNTVFHRTLEEVEKIARLRVGDIVITQYGEGKLLEIGESNKIALPWGILCTRLHNIHRKLPEQEFQEAMDHLNEIRKLHLAVECQKLNIPLQIDGCTACLLERPEYKVKRTQNQTKWSRFRQRMDESRKKKPTLWQCDVCGNPVCKYHDRQQQKGSGDHFHMCVDCAYDLNQVEHQLNPYHPNVLQSLERLLLLYTRMCLQLAFWLPYIPELCNQIFQKQRKNAKISLANTSIGFVGAALGVAGAVTLMTPAGPAIVIAAMATSATSGTLQATHQGYDKYFASKVTHEISDRLIAWQGLCCGILASLDQLRRDLLAERQATAIGLSRFNIRRSQKEADMWSTLAVGSMGVTRSAFTGVGITATMGAGYAQVINSGLQTVPVVGAAFSVAYMAMDAGNIYTHLGNLTTPNSYIVRLNQLKNAQTNGGLPHVSTVENEVGMLSGAIQDIKSKIKELREEQDKSKRKLMEEENGEQSTVDEEPEETAEPKSEEAPAMEPLEEEDKKQPASSEVIEETAEPKEEEKVNGQDAISEQPNEEL